MPGTRAGAVLLTSTRDHEVHTLELIIKKSYVDTGIRSLMVMYTNICSRTVER